MCLAKIAGAFWGQGGLSLTINQYNIESVTKLCLLAKRWHDGVKLFFKRRGHQTSVVLVSISKQTAHYFFC